MYTQEETYERPVSDKRAPLTKKQKMLLEKKLLNWHHRLSLEEAVIKNSFKVKKHEVSDQVDRALFEADLSRQFRVCSRTQKLIRKIDNSLLFLFDDDFGYCVTCGMEIGFKRLEIRPIATECYECKSISEFKEKVEHY